VETIKVVLFRISGLTVLNSPVILLKLLTLWRQVNLYYWSRRSSYLTENNVCFHWIEQPVNFAYTFYFKSQTKPIGLKLKYRAAGSGFGSRRGKKKLFPGPPHPPSKCEATKNIDTKQERLTRWQSDWGLTW